MLVTKEPCLGSGGQTALFCLIDDLHYAELKTDSRAHHGGSITLESQRVPTALMGSDDSYSTHSAHRYDILSHEHIGGIAVSTVVWSNEPWARRNPKLSLHQGCCTLFFRGERRLRPMEAE